MARPKGKLFALLAVFIAIGLVAATGAFTSVEADRTVSVDVAGDSNALLGISDNTSAGVDGSAYVDTSGDQTTIELTDGNLPNSAQGLNVNATTRFDSILTITNNGNQDIEVDITVESLPSGVEEVNVYKANDRTAFLNTSSGNTKTLTPGESEGIGLEIELDDTVSSSDSFSIDITINANSV